MKYELQCVFCDNSVPAKITLFSDKILQKCKEILSIRCLYGLKYSWIVLPSSVNEFYGYHSHCYSNFTAVNKKYMTKFSLETENLIAPHFIAFLICSHQIEVVTDAQVTSNSSLSETDAMTKYRCIEFLPPVHQELHPVVVPVSFSALPLYIDELVEPFRKGYSDFNVAKMCLKKVMLFLAEAKVCCAQRALLKLPDEPLPQKNLYLRKELEDLSSSFKQLPSPLAIYLDCIGNTNEGNFTVTPVLAEMQGIPTGHAGAISCGPRQLYPLLRSLNDGVKDEGYVELVKSISRSLPEIRWVENHHPSNCYLSDSLFSDKSKQTIRLTEEEIKQCQKLLNKLGIRYNMVSVNLLEGKGTMAQTVQTPDWDITDPFPYFCMSDLSVTDQKLGAIFGFSYTLGKEVQKSRYSGCPATAHWRGEVEPRLMLESIFESE